MKVLITGGFGYIGGRLVSYLKGKYPEIEITVAERLSSIIPAWGKEVKFFPIELLSEESVKECISQVSPECVIHLAALNEIDCIKDPVLADKVNHIGTEFLVKNSIKCFVKRFIYLSTFHVYGKAAKGIITEETQPVPLHPYAVTHLAAEKIVLDRRYENMKTLVFRLSNSYGYPMDKNINRWTLLVNDLCRQVVATGKMTLVSSGKQKRDFIPLSDVVEAIRYFLFDIPDKWEAEIYNLGSGKAISVLDMAHKIGEVYYKKYGKKAELTFGCSSSKDTEKVFDFMYSINKLKITGFNLKEDSEEEISMTMDVCRELK